MSLASSHPALSAEWRRALSRFRAEIATSRSEATAEVYERGVRSFFAWLSPRKFALGLPESSLQDFAMHGLRAGKAASSMSVYVAGVRKFCAWLVRSGSRAPVFGSVEWPRHSLPPPKSLSAPTLDAFLQRVRASSSEPYRTAMLMAPHCGLRISELVSLRLSDISAVPRKGIFVTVRGKGNKWREVPVLREFVPTLQEYLRGWRNESRRARSRWLFPSSTKPSVALDRRSLTKFFTESARALNAPITAHAMRRQYATALHESGVPAITIARALGHADSKTTSAHYIAMTGEGLLDATRKAKLSHG